jgi:hypothetical protein
MDSVFLMAGRAAAPDTGGSWIRAQLREDGKNHAFCRRRLCGVSKKIVSTIFSN